MASFRTILALAARQDWEVDAFNFNSAYLNGELGDDMEIYMEEPPGYETPGENSVVRLQKAIYVGSNKLGGSGTTRTTHFCAS